MASSNDSDGDGNKRTTPPSTQLVLDPLDDEISRNNLVLQQPDLTPLAPSSEMASSNDSDGDGNKKTSPPSTQLVLDPREVERMRGTWVLQPDAQSQAMANTETFSIVTGASDTDDQSHDMANNETSTGASNSGLDLTPLAPSDEMASSNDFDGNGNKSTTPPSTQLVLDPREVERMRGTWVLQPDDQSQAMANTETFSIVTGAPDTEDKLHVTNNTFQISPGASRAGTLHSETLKLKFKEAKKTFVPTKSFKDTKRILEKNCHVTICGASGEGKTTMALMLGQEYLKQGFDLVFVDRADVFDFGSCLSSGHKFCIIFDDIFGSLGRSGDFTNVQRLCDSLKLHMDDNLQTRAIEKAQANERQRREDSPSVDEKITPPDKEKQNPKEIYVIFTSKTYNFKNMKLQRIAFFRGKTVVDLINPESSYSKQEKLAMFQKHRDIHPRVKLGDLNVEEVIKQDSSLFGFPATCRLFFEFSSFREKAFDFFRRPLHYLRIELDQILNKRNAQAAALTLVLLCEGSINFPDLEITGRNKKVDDMLMHVMNFTSSATRAGIAAAVRSFRGTFLSNGDNTSFAHDSINEACACSLYDINPSFVLQFCSLDFLFQRLKPSHVDEANVSERLNNLFVSEDYFSLVISRLVTSMKEGIFSKTIGHPLTRNKSFVRMFLKEMCKLAMQNKDWIQAKENGKGFLYWAVKSKSLDLVKDIERALQTDFKKQDITEGLFASVECDSLDILICLASKLETEPDQTTMNELLLANAKASSEAMVKYLLDMGSSILAADTNKRTFLHHLCIQDKPSLLKLVQSHANKEDLTSAIKAVDEEGRTPLMLAALNGTWDCFELLKVEEQTATFDCYGDGLVHLACQGGNKKIVEQVITPANMEGRGQHGLTPLMIAAWFAKSDVFDLLMSQNADVSLVDDDGDTLLHLACIGGSRHIAERLVTSSNINIRGLHGRTPIMKSAWNAKSDVFDLLMSQNADVSLVDDDGDTLLHLACIGGSRHIAERLVTSSNINIRGLHGRTPIMKSAWNAKSDVFDLLMSQNADFSLVDNNGNTLLHCACIGGSRHIAERLVTSSNINIRGLHGRTPIMEAAWYAESDVFDLLMSQNADVSLVDDDGDTLLHLACIGGSRHIAERLVTSSNINIRGLHGRTPIMKSAWYAKSDVFDLLMSQNADVSLVDDDGDTLLHLACIGGSRHIAERLVTSSNINIRGLHGRTPIMKSAWNAKSDVFDLLMSQNADVSLVDDDGDTLLHLACIGGSRHIAERLVTSSNINIRGLHGRTPIMKSAWNAKSDVFDLLMSQNADFSLVDNNGNTLLHCACIGGSRHIAERLVTSSNINIRGLHGRTPIMEAAWYAESDVFDLLMSQNADVSLVNDDGDTLLHCACRGGSRHIAERLVTSSNINIRGLHGRTPIMEAAWYAKSDVFDLLMSQNADVSLVDDDGDTLLHCACRGGSRHIAERLVTSSNINIRGLHGRTPIMEAAWYAKSDEFDLLMSQNADVSLVDDDGDTLLHLACIGGSRHIAERLVTSSNINIRGLHGRTPIMKSAWNAKSDVFDLLMSQNADFSLVDNNGNTLLHCACIGGSRHIAERLVTSSNINIRGLHGRTPIMEAAWYAKSDVFDLLMSQNADVSLVDDDGDTLLHLACMGGSRHIAERLVTSSNKNIRGIYGRTPIMKAAWYAKSDVFDLLMSQNADVSLVDNDGDTLLHCACIGGSRHIAERLVTSSNINIRGLHGRTPIMKSAWNAESDVFDLLMSQNADVSLVDNNGKPLLHCACIGGSRHIAERLVTSSNINIRGLHGRTPIMEAAWYAKSDVFDLLMSQNADVSLVDDDGDTLLHLACMGGSRHIAERLVTSSNKNIRGFYGRTPIMTAAWYAKSDVFDLLMSQNADVSLVDDDGDTLLHLACMGGSRHIAERLVTSSNINTRGQSRRTPIMIAAMYGHVHIVERLREMGADLTCVDSEGKDVEALVKSVDKEDVGKRKERSTERRRRCCIII